MNYALTIVAGCAVAAACAGDLRMSFGDTAVPGNPDLPGAYPIVVDTGNAPFSVTWGVWAEVFIDGGLGAVDQWDAIGVDVVELPGLDVTTAMLNTDYAPSLFGRFRWRQDSDLGGTSGNPKPAGPNFTLVHLPGSLDYGIGLNQLPPSLGGIDTDSQYDAIEDRLFYLLGTITINAPQGFEGDLFFGTNADGFAQTGLTAPTVTFGSATPLSGDDLFGAIADTPMVTFVPEPASLALTALAGLTIRRR